MHYFKFNLKDYSFATRYFDYVHHGAYLQLMSLYYETEKPIPLDIKVVLKLVTARNEEEVEAVKHVLENFFTKSDEGYIQKRCEVEIEAFQKNSELQSIRAKKRWDKVENDAGGIPAALPEECRNDANNKPLTTKHKTSKYIPPIPAELLSDFMVVRKAKRLGALTELAFKGIQREAQTAGITVEQAITICVERGWGSFKADWEWKSKSASSSGQRMTDRRVL